MNSADNYVYTPSCANCGKDEKSSWDGKRGGKRQLKSCSECKLVLCSECIWMWEVTGPDGTSQCPFCDGTPQTAERREKRLLCRRLTWLKTRMGQGIRTK